jgi:hypothetical protein
MSKTRNTAFVGCGELANRIVSEGGVQWGSFLNTSCSLLLVAFSLFAQPAWSERVKDIATIDGVRAALCAAGAATRCHRLQPG